MARGIRDFLLVFFAFFSIVTFTGCVQAQDMFSSPLVGKTAPDFTLQRISGISRSLQDTCDGKRAVVIFWATWCPHCREQLQILHEKKQALEAKDIVIIPVNIGEGKAQIQRFLKDKGYDLDVFMDEDSSVAEMYQVLGIPTVVFIGKDGKVRDVAYQFPEDYEDILK